MAILIECDCGKNFLAGAGTMQVKIFKKGLALVTCTCPHCKEHQMQIICDVSIEKGGEEEWVIGNNLREVVEALRCWWRERKIRQG